MQICKGELGSLECPVLAHPRPALLRSPSWRSLAQAEADEMSPTVWHSGGGNAVNGGRVTGWRKVQTDQS